MVPNNLLLQSSRDVLAVLSFFSLFYLLMIIIIIDNKGVAVNKFEKDPPIA